MSRGTGGGGKTTGAGTGTGTGTDTTSGGRGTGADTTLGGTGAGAWGSEVVFFLRFFLTTTFGVATVVAVANADDVGNSANADDVGNLGMAGVALSVTVAVVVSPPLMPMRANGLKLDCIRL